VIVVWRLDRWGRSLSDLVTTLKELAELGVAFVSLTEVFDLTTPTVMAGIEQARREGRHLGRPRSASLQSKQVIRLFREGVGCEEQWNRKPG
jgi:DNA invertase Pin-like site-specific DNA recombinase